MCHWLLLLNWMLRMPNPYLVSSQISASLVDAAAAVVVAAVVDVSDDVALLQTLKNLLMMMAIVAMDDDCRLFVQNSVMMELEYYQLKIEYVAVESDAIVILYYREYESVITLVCLVDI
jgi:hypothetical protein